MEAKNLRVGNIIYIPKTNQDAEISSVVSFIGVQVNNNVIFEPIPFDDIQPIKLTEKWLFDFGFKYQDRDVNRKDGKKERFYSKKWFDEGDEFWIELQLSYNTPFRRSFCWFNWDIGGGRNFVHIPKKKIPKNVHELQNLFFALSGNELELKPKASA